MIQRPDEQVLQGEVQRSNEITRGVKGAASTIGTAALAAGSAALGAKVMPFLSSYLPANLALQGIKKVAPKFGEALSKGVEQGLNLEEGFDYLRDAFSNKSKEKKSSFEGYFPEIFQQIKEQFMASGKNPRNLLMNVINRNPKVAERMSKMEKELGKNRFDLIEEALKKEKPVEQMGQEQQPMSSQPQQQMQSGQPPQPPQQGAGNEALMNAINKIMSM